MVKLTVNLDRQVYCPGDEVKGEAILQTPKPLNVRAITVRVDGEERTIFRDSGFTDNRTLYMAKNQLLELNITVATPGELQPGEYRFPFSFQLPPNALATYNGPNANVFYYVHTNADIQMGFDAFQDLYLKVAIPRVSCTPDPSPKTFATDESSDQTKPGFVAEIQHSGYFSGDVIEGTIRLTGDGGHQVRKAQVALKTVEYATAELHHRESINIVSKVDIPGEMLTVGMAAPFRIEIPKDAPGTYRGIYSQLNWLIEINLDLALAHNVSASQWIGVLNAI